MVILNLVRTEDLRFLDQESRVTVEFSRCHDSFIIVGNTAIIEKEKFRNWKDTKKTSNNISVDNPKPSLIWVIDELVKRNLVIEEYGKAHAEISLRKLPEEEEENKKYSTRHSTSSNHAKVRSEVVS